MNEKVKKIHQESIIIDGLGYASQSKYFDEYIEDFLSVGLSAVNLTVVGTNDGPLEGILKVEDWNNYVEKHKEKLLLVTNAMDIEKAKKENKLGIIFGSQNATIIGDRLEFLGVYQRLGMRIIQISYTYQNLLGEGCGERTDSGLSIFGIEAVKEMNRLGLVIDLSHCSDRVTMDVLEYSKDPVLITHSNPRAMINHRRNKTDEQIKALAEKGGVIGMVTYAPFVSKDSRPTWEEYLNILDYTVNLVGVDHVGIGIDFSIWTQEEYNEWVRANPNLVPQGPQDGWMWRNIMVNDEGRPEYKQVFKITEGLIDRGYSDQDIKKILGLNFMRVLKQVWK